MVEGEAHGHDQHRGQQLTKGNGFSPMSRCQCALGGEDHQVVDIGGNKGKGTELKRLNGRQTHGAITS